jgi:hypothetical protein
MHVKASRSALGVAALLVSLLPLTASAVAHGGALDPGFGTHGVVRVSFPDSSAPYLADIATVGDTLEAAGFRWIDDQAPCGGYPQMFVVRLTRTGSPIGEPHSYPQQAIDCPAALVVDPSSGDIFVAGTNGDATVVRFSSSGSVLASYTFAPASAYYRSVCHGPRALLDAARGRFIAACDQWSRAGFGAHLEGLLQIDLRDGGFVGTWISGAWKYDQYFLTGRNVLNQEPIGVEASDPLPTVLSGYACANGSCLEGQATAARSIFALGAAISSPHLPIAFTAAGASPNAIAVDHSGNVVIGGSHALGTLGFIARLTPDGEPDANFGVNGAVATLDDPVVDLRPAADGRLIMLGAHKGVGLLASDGSPQAERVADAQSLNGRGSRWQSLRFADQTHTSVYLVGGVGDCATDCPPPPGSALIARVLLADTPILGPSRTTLSASPASASSGEEVTLAAHVTGSDPTGTVIFRDGASALGAPVELLAGAASYRSALNVGRHDLSAYYSGDAGNGPSTSPTVTVTVQAAVPTQPPVATGGGGATGWSELCGVLLLLLARSAVRCAALTP